MYASFLLRVTLCLQVVRIYVLARVTLKSLKSLPGLEGCQLPPDSALMNSNVYSTACLILLAWVTTHYYKVRKERVNNPALIQQARSLVTYLTAQVQYGNKHWWLLVPGAID